MAELATWMDRILDGKTDEWMDGYVSAQMGQWCPVYFGGVNQEANLHCDIVYTFVEDEHE